LRVSAIIETKPVGGPVQDDFLNAVAELKVQLTPLQLLNRLQAIEKKLGRVRTVHWGPRTMDLDILLFGSRQIKNKRLIIPHPRMQERPFVMGPLIQLLR